ncbi:MAG: hypothetical protein AAF581_05210 [Planctomycetota bacterium]
MPQSPQLDDAELDRRFLTLRIIYGVLIMGVVTFAAVAAILPADVFGPSNLEPNSFDDRSFDNEPLDSERSASPTRMLVWIAIALTATTALPAGALAGALGRRSISAGRPAASRVWSSYQAAKIMTAALIEAPGLLWCVIALLTGDAIYTAGAALCAVLMLWNFPSTNQYEDWVAAADH